MFDRQNRLSAKYKYLFGFIVITCISVICLAFDSAGNDDFDISRREVLLRRLGHEILLQSGDSISRVLPVQKISDNEYVIRFENDFTFQPDVLVNTTRHSLAKDPLSGDYVVNVLNCGATSVAYGYAVSENGKDDIIACTGRVQPRACYTINIKFKPAVMNAATSSYLLGMLLFLALGGFVVFRLNRPKQILPESKPLPTGVLTIGSTLFNPDEKKLVIDEKMTELTGTETRLLHIFALSPNETIARSRLQKEIWEDEGVIVGRSLDMFISKLRKKLETEPNANIVVVRSKGYKLEISS